MHACKQHSQWKDGTADSALLDGRMHVPGMHVITACGPQPSAN